MSVEIYGTATVSRIVFWTLNKSVRGKLYVGF